MRLIAHGLWNLPGAACCSTADSVRGLLRAFVPSCLLSRAVPSESEEKGENEEEPTHLVPPSQDPPGSDPHGQDAATRSQRACPPVEVHHVSPPSLRSRAQRHRTHRTEGLQLTSPLEQLLQQRTRLHFCSRLSVLVGAQRGESGRAGLRLELIGEGALHERTMQPLSIVRP
eukprot:scaffold8049_cov286-Pinguiococcus_pyrenoidosus.AAC.9